MSLKKYNNNLILNIKEKLNRKETIGILFICLGNICRSPAAESVFVRIIEEKKKQNFFRIDSAGTGGGASDWYQPGGMCYAEGHPADSRMISIATKKGYVISHISKRLTVNDVKNFDLLVGMDMKNRNSILTASEFWGGEKLVSTASEKIVLLSDFVESKKEFDFVPDPYHSDKKTFEFVLDMIEEGCFELFKKLFDD